MDPNPLVISNQEATAVLEAIKLSQAMIGFDLDGTVLWSNSRFCELMGYRAEELVGEHHSVFVEPDYASSPAYQTFWADLRSGKSLQAEFRRLTKEGGDVWLQASYNAVLGADGKPTQVVKVASDITSAKRASLANAGLVDAIERSMAVIEFKPDGSIVRANERFLSAVGYEAADLVGAHHRMLVKPEDAATAAYNEFWATLAAGRVVAGQFERRRKNGESVWLEATYNPIVDVDGHITRVIKFATDITDKFESARQVAENAVAMERTLQHALAVEARRKALDEALKAVATPVIPIWEGILLLPLVGIIDSSRASEIMHSLLARISEQQSKLALIDISGVPVVDTGVANQLIKITKAANLMGCETVISGLSPVIARTIVELGIDVASINTTATLQEAFISAMRKLSAMGFRREA